MQHYRYSVRHEHQFGETIHNFTSPIQLDKFYGTDEQIEALTKAIGIDYEPHKGESLVITAHESEDLTHLSLDDIEKILQAGE